MEIPNLIYCADGNRRYIEIARNKNKEFGKYHQFLIGAQMPRTVYTDDLYFIDLHPKKLPKQPVYVNRLKKYRPAIASVHDWDEMRRFEEIMMRAEEIAEYTDNVIIIPKVRGGIDMIWQKTRGTIKGKQIILGYSVATNHGSTSVEKYEFSGWPVHLLGGSPHKQFELFAEFKGLGANVVSIDGNMHNLMANRYCAFFDPLKQTQKGYWASIQDFDGNPWGNGSKDADAPYEAFRRSCHNIYCMWHGREDLYIKMPESREMF